jgi:hypothetical protein
VCKNTHTKLFKLQFSGASGNNTEWLTSARKPLETKGFRAFLQFKKNASATLLQRATKKLRKGMVTGGLQVTVRKHISSFLMKFC